MIIDRKVLETKPAIKETIDENFDMFSYSLSVVSEMNDSITLFTDTLFTEAVGKKKIFDFEAIINAIIDAFINAIKRLFRKFLALLAHLASMGSSFEIELRAFKDRIKSFNGKVKVSDSMFYFKNLDSNIPSKEVFTFSEGYIQSINERFNASINKGGLAPSELAKLEQEIVVENKVNELRNLLLNCRGQEAFADFSKNCYTFFRDGKSYPMDGVILDGSTIYNDYYLPYIDSKAEIKKIEKEQNSIEKSMAMVKARVKKEYFTNRSSYNLDDGVRSKIEESTLNIQRKLCTIVDMNCQDLVLFFGQKLQAYKDFRIQCRKILIDTIKACIVQKGGQDY